MLPLYTFLICFLLREERDRERVRTDLPSVFFEEGRRERDREKKKKRGERR
jgi:hypothetical protein